MKKWIALLLIFCLLLPCAALCETADTTEETAEETREITPHDVRYYFEHRLLPQDFFEYGETLIGYLRENGTYAIWEDLTQSNGFDVIYSGEEYGLAEYPQEDGTEVIMLTFPKPEDTPLCSHVYLCLNPETGAQGYYTVEYDNFFGESWYLCCWTKDGNHLDYGVINPLPDPEDPGYADALNAEIATVLELLATGAAPEASYTPGE